MRPPLKSLDKRERESERYEELCIVEMLSARLLHLDLATLCFCGSIVLLSNRPSVSQDFDGYGRSRVPAVARVCTILTFLGNSSFELLAK